MITVSKETTPELFKASVVSVGLLGVVTQVTMEIVKDFNLHEVMTVSRICDNPCHNACHVIMSCQIHQIHVLCHGAMHVVFDVLIISPSSNVIQKVFDVQAM